jgi:hypothetical protein
MMVLKSLQFNKKNQNFKVSAKIRQLIEIAQQFKQELQQQEVMKVKMRLNQWTLQLQVQQCPSFKLEMLVRPQQPKIQQEVLLKKHRLLIRDLIPQKQLKTNKQKTQVSQ